MSIWGMAALWGVASGGVATPQNSAVEEQNLQNETESINSSDSSQRGAQENTGETQNANV